MTDNLITAPDAGIVLGALGYCDGVLSLEMSGLAVSPVLVREAATYFRTFPRDGQRHPVSPRMATVGLKGLERAIELLDGDPELGTLVGYEPDISRVRNTLRQIVRANGEI